MAQTDSRPSYTRVQGSVTGAAADFTTVVQFLGTGLTAPFGQGRRDHRSKTRTPRLSHGTLTVKLSGRAPAPD